MQDNLSNSLSATPQHWVWTEPLLPKLINHQTSAQPSFKDISQLPLKTVEQQIHWLQFLILCLLIVLSTLPFPSLVNNGYNHASLPRRTKWRNLCENGQRAWQWESTKYSLVSSLPPKNLWIKLKLHYHTSQALNLWEREREIITSNGGRLI